MGSNFYVGGGNAFYQGGQVGQGPYSAYPYAGVPASGMQGFGSYFNPRFTNSSSPLGTIQNDPLFGGQYYTGPDHARISPAVDGILMNASVGSAVRPAAIPGTTVPPGLPMRTDAGGSIPNTSVYGPNMGFFTEPQGFYFNYVYPLSTGYPGV